MVYMGLSLLGWLKLKGLFPVFQGQGGLNRVLYFFLGVSLGFACSIEATGFLVPLWLGLSGNSLYLLCVFFVFSAAAVIPLLVLGLLVYYGFNGIRLQH